MHRLLCSAKKVTLLKPANNEASVSPTEIVLFATDEFNRKDPCWPKILMATWEVSWGLPDTSEVSGNK